VFGKAAAELFFTGPESHDEGRVFGEPAQFEEEDHGAQRDGEVNEEDEWTRQVVSPSVPQQGYVSISDIWRLTCVVVGVAFRLQVGLLR